MIGKTLAHYEILRSLGRGGMGEVYLARDTRLGREVALKFLPADLQTDPSRRARFEREAQTVAALNHPHVVTVHAVEEAGGQPFIVMEFVDGKTLDEVVDAGGLPMSRFFELALALTDAVAAAHARGITHRDLKPRNVMIDGDGRLKVLDFGLAKLLEEAPEAGDDATIAADPGVTREGTIVGTAAYMSPEQAEGKPVDNRSDVFSLGILLYQMLTGRKPFEGDTLMSTLTAVLRDEPRPVIEIRPDLPRQMSRIIRRCLEKAPDRRYESARGIHYDLRILREEMDSGEHDKPDLGVAPPPTAATNAKARRRAPWFVGAAVIVVAAVSTAWFAGRGGSDATPAAVGARQEPTVAVFPFENLGPPEDAYFAAGITDEIITSITGIDGLRVLSRTSSQQYNRAGKSMQEIADDLGVDYILEGSVRWQRNSDGTSHVRVTPQLINVAKDEQVWAQRYDRAMEEIFTVQSEIAGEVVRGVGVTLAVSNGPTAVDAPTEDMIAYHAYLRGKEHMDLSRFDAATWLLAVDMLEKAVGRDQEFHAAWVQLAKANAGLCHFNWDRTEARLARAKVAVDRARALKPDDAATHYAQGIYYYWGLKDYDRALASFERASTLNPDDTDALEGLAYVLRRQEKYAAAADILMELVERTPQNAPLAMHIAETLALVERYDEALLWSERSVDYGPDQPAGYGMGAWIAVQAGDHDRARRFLDAIPPHTDLEVEYHSFRASLEMRDYAAALRLAAALPEVLPTQYQVTSRDMAAGLAHRAMDRPEVAREDFTRAEAILAAEMQENPEAGNLLAAHAVALAGMGRHDEALAEIRRSFELYPASKDPWIATWRLWDLAYVQMLAGDHEGAVATLSELMSHQTDVISPAILRGSPHFDDLRGREDFEALLAGLS